MRFPECNPDFDEDKVVGAGILPFAVHRGRVYFLMARERNVMHWRGSHKWSAFEGSRKAGECARLNAAREFVEESLGTVPLTLEPANAGDVSEALRVNRHCMRVALKRSSGAVHVTYVVCIPYMADIPAKFTHLRRRVTHLSRLIADMLAIEVPGHMPDFNRNFRGFHIHRVVEARDLGDNNMRVTCTGGDPAVTRSIDLPLDNGYIEAVQRKIAAGAAIDAFVCAEEDLSRHPCVERSASGVRVNWDHLEKDTLRYWELDEVREAVWRNGVYKREVYRPYFIPVIEAVLAHTDHLIESAKRFAAR